MERILPEKRKKCFKKKTCEACKMYQNISEEEQNKNQKYVFEVLNNVEIFLKKKKIKKRQHGRELYRSLSEDEKQRLVENRKNYSRILLLIKIS